MRPRRQLADQRLDRRLQGVAAEVSGVRDPRERGRFDALQRSQRLALRRALGEAPQPLDDRRVGAAAASGVDLEHAPAADGLVRDAQHEEVAGRGGEGGRELDLAPALGGGRHLVGSEHAQATLRLGSAEVHGHAQVVLQPAPREGAHAHVDRRRRAQLAGPRQHLPAAQPVRAHTREVHGDAGAGQRLLELLLVRLQPPDPRLRAAGDRLDGLAGVQPPVEQRAGHHRAKARHREHAIDAEARPAHVARLGNGRERLVEGGPQPVESGAARRGGAHDRRARQRGVGEQFAQLFLDQLRPLLLLDEVELGERDNAAPQLQQVEDFEVFARLRHHALVGRDDQQREVDRADAGEHVADEADVARHVDDRDIAAGGQAHPGETQLDREPALAFLAQPVRVDPGQRLDERGFAVVDVPGRADDVHGLSLPGHGRWSAETLDIRRGKGEPDESSKST